MVKSAAQRQRERRARIKEDPEVYDNYLKNERTRKRARREAMDRDELRRFRLKVKFAVRKHREQEIQESDHQTQEVYEDARTPYKTKAAFGKAKRKVERALPQSPRKRKVVLAKLAAEVLNIEQKSVKGNSRGLSDETVKAVIKFYEDPSVSRMMPGKADCITTRTADGSKEQTQKRYLVMTLAEAYETFKQEQPEIQIGKSKFAEIRPSHVLLTGQTPQNVCGCIYHSNIILLLEALHKKVPNIIPLYSEEFLKMTVCDISEEFCMSDACHTCGGQKRFSQNIVDKVDELRAADELRWYQWKKDEEGYLMKQQQEGSVTMAMQELQVQLPKFTWHIFIKGNQKAACRKVKENSPPVDYCLIQMDFAENVTCIWQN